MKRKGTGWIGSILINTKGCGKEEKRGKSIVKCGKLFAANTMIILCPDCGKDIKE